MSDPKPNGIQGVRVIPGGPRPLAAEAGDEYTCACTHGWHRHGPEVPGCCECRCGQLVEGRITFNPEDPELRKAIAHALQYRAEKDPRGPVRHYGDFADAAIDVLRSVR